MAESKRSSETSYACERGLRHELGNRLDCHAIARNDEKICHPEFGATYVATCVNVGDICNDYLKSFSGSINVDLSVGKGEPSPAFVTFAPAHEQLLPLTKREGNSFTDKVYSLFTTHHSLIHTDTVFSRFTSHFSLKRSAFTLAEVLITLGIIGVVAALTIPTLVANYRENVLMAQFKKSYATVANGFRMSEIDNGDMKDWPMGSQMDVQDFWTTYIKPYFNSAQICMDDNDCGYHYLNNVEWSGQWWSLVTDETRLFFKLVDGTVIFMPRNTTNIDGSPSYVNYFYIDVNGPKKPNKLCYDVFTFTRGTDKGISPRGCAKEIIGNNWKIPSNYSYGK